MTNVIVSIRSKPYLYIIIIKETLTTKKNRDMTTLINKANAEFILKTATDVTESEAMGCTYWLPVYFKMTEVVINCNVVTGKFNGEWIEYDIELTDEASEMLNID